MMMFLQERNNLEIMSISCDRKGKDEWHKSLTRGIIRVNGPCLFTYTVSHFNSSWKPLIFYKFEINKQKNKLRGL
jgi:hypothetical protein